MHTKSYRLLLVEDNPGDALLLQETLEEVSAGRFFIEHAECLAAALRCVRERAFDAVLLDLGLPDSTGLATLAALKTVSNGTPVLVLTGLDDEVTALKAVQAGAADYLVKGQVFGTMLQRAVAYAIERQRSERALRESEERFRQLSERISQTFWLSTPDLGEMLYISPSFERVTGYPPRLGAADPSWFLEVVHPDDRDVFRACVAGSREQDWDVEYRVVRPDGQVRWLRARGYPIRDEAGAVVSVAGLLEDVTATRDASARIRLQAELLDAVGEAIIATRLDGTVFYWNAAAERMYGYTEAEAIGRSVMELFVTDTTFEQAQEIMARLNQGVPWTGEFQVLRRDGTTIPALVTDAPIRNEAGELVGIIGSSSDLSARKRAEAAARESDARYRTLFETMAQGVVFHGPAGEVVDANPAALEVLGLPLERVRGRGPRSRLWRAVREDGTPFPADEQPPMVALRTGQEVDGVVMGVYNPVERAYRWVLVHAHPRLGAHGATARVFTTFTDITRQREAEAALRRANRQLDAVLGTTPLPTMVVGRDGRVEMWNRAAERVFGWSAYEVIGYAYPLRGAEDSVSPDEVFAKAFEGQPWEGEEVRRYTRDGRVLDLNLWNAPLLDASGEVAAYVGVFADVTERKQLEERFRQAQKMDAVGRLAGGIAHDFNNLLSVIIGNVQLVLGDLPPSAEHLRPELESVDAVSRRAADLTRQLVTFARGQTLERRPVDTGQLIAAMERVLLRLVGENVELHTRAEPGCVVLADPSQLEQVVMNLAINARDAMPTGGRLSITASRRQMGARELLGRPGARPGTYVVLRVDDTGLGMDAATLSRIFEPFFTTKTPGKGTGLGLATVYGIVQQAGGWVTAESAPGCGASFHVYLPAAEEALPAPAHPGEAGAPVPEPAGGTVLLVEDEPALRRLVGGILRRQGYAVLEAENGIEALELVGADAGTVDLLLTDVVMPGMSGPVLADRIGRVRPGIRVLYMSGYAPEAVEPHGLHPEGGTLIQKPFSPVELARRVRIALTPG